MQTPTYYRHDDAGAPVLTGEPSSLIDFCEAILVNGYGTKPAAGGSLEFTGADKAAFRNNSVNGSGTYFRLDDSNTAFGATTFGVAEIAAYASMSDVDTGSGKWPTDAAIGGNSQWRKMICKSETLDNTPREWVALATDRTVIISIRHSTNTFRGYTSAFGDYRSIVPGDTTNVGLFCSNWNDILTPTTTSALFSPYTLSLVDYQADVHLSSYRGALKATLNTGTATGSDACLTTTPLAASLLSGAIGSSLSSGSPTFDDPPHPLYGFPLSEVYICDEDACAIRGIMPSFRCCAFDYVNLPVGAPAQFEDVVINDPILGPRNHVMVAMSNWWASTSFSAAAGYMLDTDSADWV